MLETLAVGTVSTNLFLRRLHNFALDMSWLLAPIIPRRKWPPIRFGEKRAITLEEHGKILAGEQNPELHDSEEQAAVDSTKLTKAEWREKVRPYYNPVGGVTVTTAAKFKAMFREPSRTSSLGSKVY